MNKTSLFGHDPPGLRRFSGREGNPKLGCHCELRPSCYYDDQMRHTFAGKSIADQISLQIAFRWAEYICKTVILMKTIQQLEVNLVFISKDCITIDSPYLPSKVTFVEKQGDVPVYSEHPCCLSHKLSWALKQCAGPSHLQYWQKRMRIKQKCVFCFWRNSR